MKIISGIVLHGQKLGRTLWFPTANISCPPSNFIEDAVFFVSIVIKEYTYYWAGSYRKEKNVFEVHIFDFSWDIYGEYVEIILLKKIRDNKQFPSLEALKSQITADIEYIKRENFYCLTFGSFDYIHCGHKHYLGQAKRYWKTLITILARDSRIQQIKWSLPLHTQEERKKQVKALWISDIIHIWDEYNPFIWLEKYKPSVICLGYDQRGKLVEALESEIQRLRLQTEIIRIGPLRPETYKSSLLKKKEKAQ